MNGDERRVGKRCVLALMAVLALSLCQPQMAAAQGVPQGNETHGTFGNRPLGQTLVPRPSQFGGGIQTGPGGSFLYRGRPDGSTAFAAPWRRIDPGAIEQAVGARPAVQAVLYNAASPQSPGPEYNNLSELPTFPELTPAPLFETNGGEGTGPAEQGLGMALGFGLPSAWNVTLPRVGTGAASAPPQPYVRSPELSDRLTRIAVAKGMLAGQGIDVLLSNSIARLQGTVHTPDNCVLLANVLALEPEVSQIDNRLVVEGAGTPPSNPNRP